MRRGRPPKDGPCAKFIAETMAWTCDFDSGYYSTKSTSLIYVPSILSQLHQSCKDITNPTSRLESTTPQPRNHISRNNATTPTLPTAPPPIHHPPNPLRRPHKPNDLPRRHRNTTAPAPRQRPQHRRHRVQRPRRTPRRPGPAQSAAHRKGAGRRDPGA
ncbi:hypothetical protein M8818_004844 [Zalaria obscura]|uniref:Uncharacterized protein n=1 Tax=Zalaria obscura TaxID=2024903 RepID=A0ACC3SBC6_9PEZI